MEETYPAFAFLQNKGELSGANPVSTTTEFAISQLPALKSILDDLGPRLEKLANGDEKQGLVGEDQKSWRRERLEFVEKEARRHLENVRGLELGEQGEVRDGEWQGEGRKLGKGEVEDLERVVAMVGSGQGDPMDTGA
jgi:kinetochore protein Mis12/MTW1